MLMVCPQCRVELKMSDRNGIEIDYCPQCRGVWLDRGELDKIIERSMNAQHLPEQRPQQQMPPQMLQQQNQQPQVQPYGQMDDDGEWYIDRKGRRRRRRDSWLDDIFDFD